MQMRALSKGVSRRWPCVCRLCMWGSQRERGGMSMHASWRLRQRHTCRITVTLSAHTMSAVVHSVLATLCSRFFLIERLLGRTFLPTFLCCLLFLLNFLLSFLQMWKLNAQSGVTYSWIAFNILFCVSLNFLFFESFCLVFSIFYFFLLSKFQTIITFFQKFAKL